MEKDGSVRGPSRPELPIHRAVPNDDVLVGLPLVSGRVHAGQGVGRGAKSSTFPQHGTSSEDRSLWNPLTWKLVPTEEEIQKYRHSWNPFSHGPILNTGIDIQPKGQFLIQPFVFSEFGHQQFPNRLTTDSVDSRFHLRAVAPTVIFAYGITNHLELNVAPSYVWFESTRTNASGQQTSSFDRGPGTPRFISNIAPSCRTRTPGAPLSRSTTE